MKTINLILVLVGAVILQSCGKDESIMSKTDDLGGTASVNELKAGRAGTIPMTINFLGVQYTAQDNSIFTYQVISGTKPALSHWNLNIMPDLTGAGIAEVLVMESSDPTASYGQDGSLKKIPGEYKNLPWLKFDSGYSDGETRLVSFTLKGRWQVGDILSISKSGNTYIVANLPGPTQTIIPELVVVTKTEVVQLDSYSTTVSGLITGEGGGITERGICWSTGTNTNPTLSDSHTSDGLTLSGDFACTLVGLEPGIIYYARAYAICNTGTIFGNIINFTNIPIR